MKGYILFFLLIICSFALADENTHVLGTVKILDDIPSTSDTVLEVVHVFNDPNHPGYVVLTTTKQNGYDALVIDFERFRNKVIVSQKFGDRLEQDFEIEIAAKDLKFSTHKLMSLLQVDAVNISSLTQGGTQIAIKECTAENSHAWNVWTSDIQLTNNCL